MGVPTGKVAEKLKDMVLVVGEVVMAKVVDPDGQTTSGALQY